MATILDTLKKGADYLQRHGVDEARLNMERLLSHVLGVDRMRLYLDFDRPLPEDQLAALRDLTVRRGKGEPLQHLLGTVEFCELEFLSDARALVPRPETEELVQILLSRPWPDRAEILDLGCGTGAIGLSLAHHLAGQDARVTLSDLSPDALALARENAARLLPADAPLRFVEGDLFAPFGEDERFDLVAANLPYVPLSDKAQLSREVHHDPALALYGGERGTETMERFLASVGPRLRPGGLVAMEFGIGQAPVLLRHAEARGLRTVQVRKDLDGVERFLLAESP